MSDGGQADSRLDGALYGVRLGLSVSESPDLGFRGLTETHLRLVLAEIARTMLISGASIAYGGHLGAGGYTAFLWHELQRYGRRDQPLKVFLAWHEHRIRSLSSLAATEEELGLYGEIFYLDPDGEPIRKDQDRGEDPEPVAPEGISRALSGMRRHMADSTDARALVGGRRSDFQGDIPGVLEEALLAVENEQPLYLLGGFGGVTSDMVRVLGLDPEAAFPPPPDTEYAPELEDALAELSSASRGRSAGWTPDSNGLTLSQIHQLVASHRPGEAASLLSLGLLTLRREARI